MVDKISHHAVSQKDDVIGDSKSKGGSRIALCGLAVTGTLAVGVSMVTFSFVSPALRRFCLPFVPATENQIRNVLKLCNNTKNINSQHRSSLVDLGSGDGRIVMAAAKSGYHATGYELNPWLVLYSKLYACFSNLSSATHFERKDLWKADLQKFDNIVIFGVADMMNELSEKLESDMNENTRVIACRFEVPRWKAVCEIQDGVDSTWLYTKESF